MKSYKHFTLKERICLQELLEKGKKFREIARILGRDVSTISREVKRNRAKYKPHKKPSNKYWYSAWRAQNLYTTRRRSHKRFVLQPNTPEWNYIVEKLNLYWSPEEISNRWHIEFPERAPLCISTIYRYVKMKKFPAIKAKTHLRRREKRISSKQSNFNTIHPDRTIPQWAKEILDRSRIGDWEGDTIYGAVGKGLLVSMVDRKTRYLKLARIPVRNADITRIAIENMLQGLPVCSISLDNGSEFAEFNKLEENLDTLVYFAEPHKPWQRGTNENTNDIVRFFFPKGFDFTSVSDDDVQAVEDLINHRPRKILNWHSPAELFFS